MSIDNPIDNTIDNPKELVIAIDLGGTKIDIGLIGSRNATPVILQRTQLPTNPSDGAQSAVDRISKVVQSMTATLSGSGQVRKVAICTPGPVDNINGVVHNAHNLGWGVVPLADMLKASLSLPVIVEHDAKAAALGEFYWGTGKNRNSMVYIVIGTGMGGAIIHDGVLHRGERNAAGELGQITLDYQGDTGNSGIPGNAEYFIAGPGLINYYHSLSQKEGRAVDTSIDGHKIGELARSGDEIATKVIHRAGYSLGITIGALAMILDITLYVIGSSVAKLGDLLLNPAREALPKYSFASVAKGVTIEKGTIIDNAALFGCYSLTQKQHNGAVKH